MATFKVGDRVKVVSGGDGQERQALGTCGTVIGLPGPAGLYEVRMDIGLTNRGFDWLWWPHELAPLTDPKADEFIESLKKLKPLHEEPRVVHQLQAAWNKVLGA